jgi:nitroreductase
MDAIELLINRNSEGKLIEPAPSENDLNTILQAALRAPDHARMRPWRFLIVEGQARHKLGESYARAAKISNPDIKENQLDKFRKQPLRAPLMIVVIASIGDNPKVPVEEQWLSAGCAAHSILLASQALGYGGIWRTGANAYADSVKSDLGLASNEHIIGYLYLGTPAGERKVIEALEPDFFCQRWD